MKRHMRVRSSSSAEIDRHVHREFPAWFTNQVINDPRRGDFNPDFVALATGPCEWARRFTAYNVNGFKFRTMARDNRHATQNLGFLVCTVRGAIATIGMIMFSMGESPIMED